MRKEYKAQLILIISGFIILYAMVIGRLYQIQILNHESYLIDLENQSEATVTITPLRGDIADRKGCIIATSKHLNSLYINAWYLKRSERELQSKKKYPEINHDELAQEFAEILNLPVEEVKSKFKKSFSQEEEYQKTKKLPRGSIAIARLITDAQHNAIKNIMQKKVLPGMGIWMQLEEKRLYPRGDLASPTIGVTRFDAFGEGTGNLGLERFYDNDLKGKIKTKQIKRTGAALGIDSMVDEDLFSFVGNRLVLTLDIDIQEVAENALRKTLGKYKGDSGVAIVQKTKTGEILAIASLPSFNPENYGDISYPEYCLRNNCVQTSIEPGSVAKILSFTALLDQGLIKKTDMVNCYGGRKYFGRRLIKDVEGENFGVISAADVFRHSSNVGTDMLALKIDPEVFRGYLQRYGVGQKTGVDLPGEEDGIFHSTWSGFTMTSLPIGYEMALTPVQVITAVSAIANNGVMMKPFLVREIKKHNGDLIKRFEPHTVNSSMIAPTTSAVMRELMEEVVLTGTGKALKIPGYRIGGKTGTTRKSNKLEREYIASFAGIFPVDDPEITVYCWIDNPKGKFYASDVAVPFAKEIFEGVIKILGYQPSEEIIPDTKTNLKTAAAKIPKRTKAEEKAEVEEEADMDFLFATADENLIVAPNLMGLTMKSARMKLIENNIADYSFLGSGVVVEQTPAPGEILKKDDKIIIKFDTKNQG